MLFFLCKFLFNFSDVDECEQYHPCNENSLCINTLGSYDCKCMSGFEQASITSKECIGNFKYASLIVEI